MATDEGSAVLLSEKCRFSMLNMPLTFLSTALTMLSDALTSRNHPVSCKPPPFGGRFGGGCPTPTSKRLKPLYRQAFRDGRCYSNTYLSPTSDLPITYLRPHSVRNEKWEISNYDYSVLSILSDFAFLPPHTSFLILSTCEVYTEQEEFLSFRANGLHQK